MDAYKQAGVDYASLDPAKILALTAARRTSEHMAKRSGTVFEETRGEPAFVFDIGDCRLAFVLECLGTKSVLAQQYLDASGRNHFSQIGYDSVAAIVNDMVCVGALPLTINAYFATGASDWYDNRERFEALVDGWSRACADSGATWGGGESPTLSGLVAPSEIEIAGAGVGRIPPGRAALAGGGICEGDEILLFESSGLHANGASLARRMAKELPDGLSTKISGNLEFGEALLNDSVLYTGVLEALYELDVDVHYLSHITGHGFLKLMRADRDFTYRITELPAVPPVLSFMVDHLGMSPREAYTTFNMGAGMAAFVPPGSASEVLAACRERSIPGIHAGTVEAGARRVILEPLDETLVGDLYAPPSATE